MVMEKSHTQNYTIPVMLVNKTASYHYNMQSQKDQCWETYVGQVSPFSPIQKNRPNMLLCLATKLKIRWSYIPFQSPY